MTEPSKELGALGIAVLVAGTVALAPAHAAAQGAESSYIVPVSSGAASSEYVAAPGEPETRTNWALVGSGIGLLAGGYAVNLLSVLVEGLIDLTSDVMCIGSIVGTGGTCMDAVEDAEWTLIPLVGGFIRAGISPTFEVGGIVYYAVLDLIQLTGLGLLIGGLVSPIEVEPGVALSITPRTFAGGAGMGLELTF